MVGGVIGQSGGPRIQQDRFIARNELRLAIRNLRRHSFNPAQAVIDIAQPGQRPASRCRSSAALSVRADPFRASAPDSLPRVSKTQ
jgi:hypothetical protein